MKLIIEIPEMAYEAYKEWHKNKVASVEQSLIATSTPLPEGEWEEPFESNGRKFHKCTHCHISSMVILFDNFCPNCGADMKGGAK